MSTAEVAREVGSTWRSTSCAFLIFVSWVWHERSSSHMESSRVIMDTWGLGTWKSGRRLREGDVAL